MSELQDLLGRNVECEIDWGKLPDYVEPPGSTPKEVKDPAEAYAAFPSLVITGANGTKLSIKTLNDDDIIDIMAIAQVYYQMCSGMVGAAVPNDALSIMSFQIRVRMRMIEMAKQHGDRLMAIAGLKKQDLDPKFHAEFDRLFGGDDK